MIYVVNNPNDDKILELIAEGYNTVPKICKHLLGIPSDFNVAKLPFDDWNTYCKLRKYCNLRCRHMEKRRELFKSDTGIWTCL